MRKVLASSMATLCLFMTACVSAPGAKIERLTDREGVEILLIPAEYREVYMIPKGVEGFHCRAPDPDFTVQSSNGIGLGVNNVVTDETLSVGDSQAALNLGARSPAVLLTRELIYRACELSANVNANKDETIAIYERFLQSVDKLNAQQTSSGVSVSESRDSTSYGSIRTNFNDSISDRIRQKTDSDDDDDDDDSYENQDDDD